MPVLKPVATLVALSLFVISAAWAQVSNGRIEGTVQDATGAVVTGATVTVRNVRNGAVVTATTTEQGQFVVTALPTSIYSLSVEKAGFRKAQIERIELSAATIHTEIVKLEVGATTESVTVEAVAVQVNTSDAQMGRSVTMTDIATLPQLGRSPMALAPYQTGVSFDPGDNTFSRVNGTRQGSNNTRLDGIDANDSVVPRFGLSMVAVNVDSVEEMRVVTNGGKAEYGRNAGGQIEMVTRSGTNTWHGNAYEYLRNTKLHANNFFNNSSGVARPKFIQNNFGASVGGPIMRNKFFIFGNWQSNRLSQDTVRNRTVLTPEAKQGIFRWRAPGSQAISSYSIVQNDPRGLGIDPTMGGIFKQLPDPNNFDVGDGLNTAGFRFNNPSGATNDQFTIKGDYQLTSTHRVFYRHSWFKTSSIDALNNADAIFPGQPQGTQGGTRWGFSAGSDWNLAPTLINEFRVGYASASIDFLRPNRPTEPVVISNLFTDPYFTGFAQGRNSPVIDLTENLTKLHGKHTFKGGFTYKRTLQYGYNDAGIYANLNLSTANNNLVPATIGPTVASGAIATADRQRFEGLWNDVLGRVGNTTQTFYSDLQAYQAAGTPRVRNTVFRDYSFFFQDDWKVRSNLTLNLGVRYDVFTSPVERDEMQGTLDGIARLGYGYTADNLTIQRQGNWFNTDRNNFAPRFGFVWDPFSDGKTAIRGGYGVYFDRMIGATANLVDGNTAGFSTAVQTFPNSAAGSDVRLSNGIPLPAPVGTPQVTLPSNRQTSIVVFNPNLGTGYVQHFNLTIQREITRNAVVDFGYVRTMGVGLFNWVDLNQPKIYGDFLNSFQELQRFQANGTAPSANNTLVRIFGTPAAALSSLGASTVQQGQVNTAANTLDRTAANYNRYAAAGVSQFYVRNYPQYNQVIYGQNDGRSYYDSFQLSFRRTQGDLRYQANYTWSKAIDNTSVDGNGFTAPADNFNMQQNKGRSTFDRPHVFNVSATYMLPFGKGKKWGSNWNGAVDRILGGWEVGVLSLWQSGSTFTMSSGRLTGPSGANTWINYSGDRSIGSVDRRGNGVFYFTPEQVTELTAASAFPGAGEFGSAGRNTFRGPRFFNFDASVVKAVALPWEQHRIVFRWEFFNAFNNTNFGLPGSTITTPTNVGRISGIVGSPRIMQAALRYEF